MGAVAAELDPAVRSPGADVFQGEGNAAAGAAALAAQDTIARARGRGRPRKSPSSDAPAAGASKKAELAAAQERMERALKEIYKPENWKGIVRAPADLMQALTGDPLWELEDEEVTTLAAQSSLAAQYFMHTDPKWVALTMFAFSVMTSYGSRAFIHFKKIRQRKEEQ